MGKSGGIKGGRPTGPALEGNDKPKERFIARGGGARFGHIKNGAQRAPFFTFQFKKGVVK